LHEWPVRGSYDAALGNVLGVGSGPFKTVKISTHAKCCGAAFGKEGSLPSFAAQSTNGRNAKNRPFAALVANVSVADFPVIRFSYFADAASLRVCGMPVAALQLTSPMRPFNLAI